MTLPEPSYREIELTQGKITRVSAHRYDDCSSLNWYAWKNAYSGKFYAVRSVTVLGVKMTIPLHRYILGLAYGDPRTGDHVDPNQTLDNTDGNLRIAPYMSLQHANKHLQRNSTSGYKGVSYDKVNDKWYAHIKINGVMKNLGRYKTAFEAHLAYCYMASWLFGEFARFS